MNTTTTPSFPKTTEELIQQEVELQGQVIVKVILHGKEMTPLGGRLVTQVNISDETFLYPNTSEEKIKMSHAFGIHKKPFSNVVFKGQVLHFSLVFPGLPRNCTNFHVVEEKADGFGFFFKCIPRNKSDVYVVLME